MIARTTHHMFVSADSDDTTKVSIRSQSTPAPSALDPYPRQKYSQQDVVYRYYRFHCQILLQTNPYHPHRLPPKRSCLHTVGRAQSLRRKSPSPIRAPIPRLPSPRQLAGSQCAGACRTNSIPSWRRSGKLRHSHTLWRQDTF